MYENKLMKNVLILAFGQLIPKLLSVVILLILTNQFSTREYGQYDLAIVLSSMILPILTLQIYQAVFRELLAEKNIEAKSMIIATSLIFLTFNSLLVGIILSGVLLYKGLGLITAVAITLSVVGESFYTLTGQIIRGLDNNIGFSIGAIIYSIVNVLLICILLITDNITVITVIIGIAISYSFAAFYMLYKSREIIGCNFKFEKKVLKKLLKFSVPIIPNTISLWIVNISDRLLVTYFLGVSLNGIYSVATKIPNLYNSAYGIFNMAWFESASRAEDEGQSEEYFSRLFEKLFDFLTGSILILLSILPILFFILIDKKFYIAYNQSVILLSGAYINSFAYFYGGIYFALRKMNKVASSSLIGAFINLVINLLFIKVIGLYAASLSTMLSFFSIAIYRAVDTRKYIKMNYDMKKILFGLAVVFIANFMVFQKKIILNILVFLIACIYNRKNWYLVKNITKIGGRKNENGFLCPNKTK